MKKINTLIICSSFVAANANAAVFTLYADAADEAGLATQSENGTDTFASTASGVLRVADLSTTAKPEASWTSGSFGGDINTAFLLTLDAINNATVIGGSVDINLRMSNPGVSLGSKSNQLTTISFEQSDSIKVDGSTAHNTAALTSYGFLINVDPTSSLQYTYGDQTNATLAADTTITFVNGVLTHTKLNPSGGTGFDNSLGVNRIGFVGESNSKTGVDYSFDNVVLSTEADAGILVVPEPSSALLSLLGGMIVLRRRRA